MTVQLFGADPDTPSGLYASKDPRNWLQIGSGPYPPTPSSHPHLVRIPAAVGVTDEGGKAEISVPLEFLPPGARADEGGLLWGRVEHPGFCSNLTRVQYRSSDPHGHLSMQARPGVTVNGVIRTEQGEAVPGWIKPLDKHGRSHDAWPRRSRSVPGGAFELDLARDDEFAHQLVVDAGPAGTGVMDALSDWRAALENSEPNDATSPFDATVSGRGHLCGRLVDGNGQALAGFTLVARSTILPDHYHRELPAAGALERSLQTDLEGRFDFAGMSAGTFDLHVTGDQRSEALTPEPLAADGEPLVLVHAVPTVLIRLEGAHGSSRMRVIRNRSRSPFQPAGESSFALVRRIDGRIAQSAHYPWSAWGVGLSNSLAVFELTSPGTYEAVVWGGGMRPTHRQFEVGAGRAELAIRTEPASEFGTVRVMAVDADGQPSSLDHRLSLEFPDRPVVLHAPTAPGRDGWYTCELAAGHYRAVFDGVWGVMDGQVYGWPRAAGRAELLIEAVAGETREYKLSLDVGGRLSVEVLGQPSAADRAEAFSELSNSRERRGPDDPTSSRMVELTASRVALTLVHPARRPEQVQFMQACELREIWKEARARIADAGNETPWPTVALGSTATSEVVPAGTFLLTATLPGGRELRRTIQVRPGEETPVRLDFGPGD